jgi:hypothetical protein
VEGHAILRGLAGAQAVGLDAQAIVQLRRLRLRHELLVFSLPTRTVEQSHANIRVQFALGDLCQGARLDIGIVDKYLRYRQTAACEQYSRHDSQV